MNSQAVVSIVTGFLGFVTFTILLVIGKIETPGYWWLLALLSFVCVIIPLLSRLRELDMRNLRLTLQEMKETKNEIYVKEAELKESAFVLSELIAANATLTGIWGDEESTKYSKLLVRSKLVALAEKLKFNENEQNQLFKYEQALAEVHNATKEQHEEKWSNFKSLLKEEAEKNA